MPWKIGRTIEAGRMAARFLMDENTGQMIPWHQLVEDGEMRIARSNQPVFMRRAAETKRCLALGMVARQRRPQGIGQELS